MTKEDGSEEDMCSKCLGVVYAMEHDIKEDYVFSELTENLVGTPVTKPKKIDY